MSKPYISDLPTPEERLDATRERYGTVTEALSSDVWAVIDSLRAERDQLKEKLEQFRSGKPRGRIFKKCEGWK